MNEDVTDREIVVSRLIEGPRPLVFDAYTEVRHVSKWWGPNGFTTTTRSFDFRPGGVWEFTMHGPDGTDYPNWIEFTEISPPSLIAYRQGTRRGDPDEFTSTVELVERGEETEVTIRTVFATREQRDELVKSFGAIEGAEQTLDRLNVYMKRTEGE
ncbi:MAG: ATPase [Acidimicrobiia bacterium]|nr:ATPase [Acidimicrobiia bacterium]